MILYCSSLFTKNTCYNLLDLCRWYKILRNLRFYRHVVFKHCVFKKQTALTVLHFSQCDISSHTSAVLNVTWYRSWGAHTGHDSCHLG
jgi:hypothetical protein